MADTFATTSRWGAPLSLLILSTGVLSTPVLAQSAPTIAGVDGSITSSEQAFNQENAIAMERMMADMAVPPSGDIDRDFVATMEPHHEGAVAMAIAELRYGKNAQLKRIAQEIIVEQRQEIDAMRLAIGGAPLSSAPAPTQPPPIGEGASVRLVSSAKAGRDRAHLGNATTPVTHHDRVYAAEQFSNTVSVIDPADNRMLGVIRLGEPQPTNFSPLYRGQVLVHGMGFSPDGKMLAVVSIGSNSVTFIDTATNAVKHTTYIGRSPHEAFYTPDGREVWVTVRGEDYVAVLNARSYEEIARVKTPNGPGMTIFSPDGRYAYVCSSFTPELVVFDVATRKEAGRVAQPSPFCPNIAATADGKQVWYTLKDTDKTIVIDARPPFRQLQVLETGPITNHVNFVDNANGRFAYVTVGGLNEIKVFRRDDFALVATIPVGKLPHGLWPSGDGTLMYTSMENGDEMLAIDTLSNRIVARVPIGQAAQAMLYVPNAVQTGDGTANLQPLGVAASATELELAALSGGPSLTSVSLFDQGTVQILEAAVTGLQPGAPYVLGLAERADGSGEIVPLASFSTNPSGAAVVNATGPIRSIVSANSEPSRRYLVIAPGRVGEIGAAVQVQTR